MTPTGGSNVVDACTTHEGKGRVPDGGERLWNGPHPHLRAVLIEGDIAHIGGAVLDDLMPTRQGEQTPRGGTLIGATRHTVDRLMADLARL